MAPVSHVNVLTVGDELLVTWRGGSATTSIFVSHDPDDAGVDVRAPDEPGRVVLARTDERVYVHILEPDHGFTVAAERRIDLDGPDNFRDLGGYPTTDGAEVRWGVVYRSDRLDSLTDTDHERIGRLGITTVFDLRSDEEVGHAPDRLPDGVAHVHLPMSSDTRRGRSIYQRIVEGDLERYGDEEMADGYLRMLDAFGDHLAHIIEGVASGERVLVHCTAGKDRTGVVSMVLLGLAGVADPHLLDDYEMTNRYRPSDHDGRTSRGTAFSDLVKDKGLDPADFEALWQAPRPVMRRTVDGLRERWGDHRSYARSIGLDEATIDAVRDRMRRTN